MGWLGKVPFEVLLLAFGCLLLAAGLLDLTHLDPKHMSLALRPKVAWLPFVLGGTFSAAAIALFVLRQGLFPIVALAEVKKTSGGFQSCFGRTEISVHFGRLEDVVAASGAASGAVVLLPANEFFDDDCLDAQLTACGAYIQARLPHARAALPGLIASARNALPAERVEKEPGRFEPSYGTGTCLLLRPPGVAPPLMLASVATKRAGTGLRSDIGDIFKCVECSFEIMSDESLDTVFMPLLGAGKGHIFAEAAFLALLLSVSLVLRRRGKGPNHLHLVIFQPAQKPADMSRRAARRMLNLAAAMHKDWK